MRSKTEYNELQLIQMFLFSLQLISFSHYEGRLNICIVSSDQGIRFVWCKTNQTNFQIPIAFLPLSSISLVVMELSYSRALDHGYPRVCCVTQTSML